MRVKRRGMRAVPFFFGESLRRGMKAVPFFLGEMMRRESSWSELVQVFLGKPGGISRITCTVSTG